MDIVDSLSLGQWNKQAQPGQMFVYAQTRHLTDSYAYKKIGIEAWKLAITGEVYLVQQQVPNTRPRVFNYIAIKASRPPRWSLVTSDYGDPEQSGFKYRKQRETTEQVNGQ